MKIRIAIGWLMVLGVIAILVRIFVFGGNIPAQGYTWKSMSVLDQALVVYGIASCLGLWFWMLVDYFHVRPRRFSVFWGFSLLFLVYIAALVYFVLIYSRRATAATARP